MVQPTYEEGYKRGVEDSLFILDDNGIAKSTTAYVRKKLLTKKVTRWVAIYQQGPDNAPYAGITLFDSETDASRHDCRVFVKAVPVEIEVPL